MCCHNDTLTCSILHCLTVLQVGQDKDIARIVEMGFSASQASSALQQSNGDVNQAINALLSNDLKPGGDLRREQGGNVRGRDIPTRDDRRERGLLHVEIGLYIYIFWAKKSLVSQDKYFKYMYIVLLTGILFTFFFARCDKGNSLTF